MTGDSEALTAPESMRAAVLRAIEPLLPRLVPLAEADGLILTEPVVAGFDLPRFANAAMDGFAVRSRDTTEPPVRLRVVATTLAGKAPPRAIGAGEAMAIATGAMVPSGADAILPLEAAEVPADDADSVVARAGVIPGQHIRLAGEDVRSGDVVLDRGTVLGPGQVAAAAAFGLSAVMAHPRPVVTVVPTGDEVRPAGEPIGEGQVYDAVSAPLALLLREAGAIPRLQPPVADDADRLLATLRDVAPQSEAILTVGGVSSGPRDLVRRIQAADGEVRGFRLALRPAKPFAFGRVFGVPLFGLPGSPAAALAAFEELVRPALLAMLGKPAVVRPAVSATLAEPFAQKPGRLHLVRAEVWREGDRLVARPAGRQGASMIHSLARAAAWAAIPPDVTELPAGAEIQVRLLVDVP